MMNEAAFNASKMMYIYGECIKWVLCM